MGRQAFDRARSIDPSLALPWAGMSADIYARLVVIFMKYISFVYHCHLHTSRSASFLRELTPDEAYESCLRAVQILPVSILFLCLAFLNAYLWTTFMNLLFERHLP